MNNIQKLIDELEARKEKAQKVVSGWHTHSEHNIAMNRGIAWAFSFCVQKLTLLLNAEAETNGEKDCKNDGNVLFTEVCHRNDLQPFLPNRSQKFSKPQA